MKNSTVFFFKMTLLVFGKRQKTRNSKGANENQGAMNSKRTKEESERDQSGARASGGREKESFPLPLLKRARAHERPFSSSPFSLTHFFSFLLRQSFFHPFLLLLLLLPPAADNHKKNTSRTLRRWSPSCRCTGGATRRSA